MDLFDRKSLTPSPAVAVQADRLVTGDCVAGMKKLPAGSIDLVFADPPFNIGYTYDVYEDEKEAAD